MSLFAHHTMETAPDNSKPLMQMAQDNFGFLPNLMTVMAESPAMLEAYMTIMGLLDKTDLDAVEQQVVLMTINRFNQCHYCMAAHSTISMGTGMDEAVLEALRTGTVIPDERLEALSSFTDAMLEHRGWVSDERIQEFLDVGFEKSHVMAVIICIAGKTLSNYVNHICDTELDEVFKPMSWSNAAQQEKKG